MTILDLIYCHDLVPDSSDYQKLQGGVSAWVSVGAGSRASGNLVSSTFAKSGAYTGAGKFQF